jgi:Sec-independent protein translocase protein TatA
MARQTIKDRIIINLQTGPKRYSELMRAEAQSIEGFKNYLQRGISEAKGMFKRPGSEKFKEALERTIKEFERYLEMITPETNVQDFTNEYMLEDRPLNMYFGTHIRELVQSGRIIKISKGLYKIKEDRDETMG